MQLVGAPCSFLFVCHLNFVWHNFEIRSTTPTKMYRLPSQMIVHNGFCLRLITHTNPELHFAITPHSHYLSDNEICAFGLRACVTNIKIYYRSPWLYNNLKNVGPFVGNDLSNEDTFFTLCNPKFAFFGFADFEKQRMRSLRSEEETTFYLKQNLLKIGWIKSYCGQATSKHHSSWFRHFFPIFFKSWFWAHFRQFQRNYDKDWTWTQGV